jgi:hypothetical protein
VFILFCKESPRWLYATGRREEAAAVLAHFHSKEDDAQSPIVKLQLLEIEESIALDGADKVSLRVDENKRYDPVLSLSTLSHSDSGIFCLYSGPLLIGTEYFAPACEFTASFQKCDCSFLAIRLNQDERLWAIIGSVSRG